MNKKTLGEALYDARTSLHMSQRDLAKLVGVKASHIGYIEHAQRKPSLALLRRLANVLGLETRELFFLCFPEAKQFLGTSESPSAKNDAWQRFTSNAALLRRHSVSRAELKLLKQVTLLQHVSHPSHFVFILNSIRQAGVPAR